MAASDSDVRTRHEWPCQTSAFATTRHHGYRLLGNEQDLDDLVAMVADRTPNFVIGDRPMKIAINGCGIAGPALAYWLARAGHESTIIEQAPELRSGGYIIDFWGVGYDIVEKMGLLPSLRDSGYQVGEVRFVDSRGRPSAGFSTGALRRLTRDRFTSLRRSDLAAALHSALNDSVETIFADSIASIEDRGDRLRVSFDRAAPRSFDLAIGADGLHSRVRQIAFGPEEQFAAPLGLHVAAFESTGYRPRDELVYVSHTRPGRQVSRLSMRGDKTLFLFVFRDEQLEGPPRATEEYYRAALRHVFGKDGWESPQILAALDTAREIYFDRVSQIKMARWAKGRTGLVGDAAACISLLGGEGAGLAILEAYILAGELARANGDHGAAFAAYQERLLPLVRVKQEAAKKFASIFAPRSSLGLAVRNLTMNLMRIPLVADWLIGRDLRDNITLPDYTWQ
jgi:2-polyprenyl-6-methoxyphenol hydroxylase-like FAD-dependent oxidoreductase